MTPQRRRRLWISYGLDWILTIGVWAVFYAIDKVNGYRRLFSITDTSLHHPYAEDERIHVWHLALIAGVFPLVVILVWTGAVRRSWFDAQVGVLGLGLTLGLTVTFTNIIKITAGRPRPDLLDRCQPPPNTSNPGYGLTSWTVCTRTDLLNEGFRSFPSGHSSFGWAGMWYLTLFAAGKMRIWDRKGFTLKSWLLLIPITAGTLISVSRTMDYRHHSTDVIAGAVVGILVAWYCYRQYYPALSDPTANRPYPPRIPREDEDELANPDDIESNPYPNSHSQIPTEVKDTERYPSSENMDFPRSSPSGQSHGEDLHQPASNRISLTDTRTPLVPLQPTHIHAHPGVYPPMGSNASTSGSQYAYENAGERRRGEVRRDGSGTGATRGENFM